MFCVDIYKPNSVAPVPELPFVETNGIGTSGRIVIYLGSRLLSASSGTPRDREAILRSTALHSGKDFAVSAGLNRVISVRTSIPLRIKLRGTTGVTRYLFARLRMRDTSRRMFGLSYPASHKATQDQPSGILLYCIISPICRIGPICPIHVLFLLLPHLVHPLSKSSFL